MKRLEEWLVDVAFCLAIGGLVANGIYRALRSKTPAPAVAPPPHAPALEEPRVTVVPLSTAAQDRLSLPRCGCPVCALERRKGIN